MTKITTNENGLPTSAVAAKIALKYLKEYLPAGEYRTLWSNCDHSEEQDYFRKLVVTMAEQIKTMPATRGQENVADPIVYLHYFQGGMDWYITEKDIATDGQHQAFGLANLGYGGELGYISIVELVANHVELDLHFTPAPLSQFQKD